MSELKKPDEKELSFNANGKKYTIEQSISFERYKLYQKLQIECGYDVSFYGMFEALQKLYALQNEGKLADAAVLTHNLMSGISNIDKRQVPVLEMCALFINTETEDRKIITQEIVDAKIKDWQEEGIAVDYFFTIATATMQNFTKACNEVSQSSFLMKKLRKVAKLNTQKDNLTK